MEDMNSIYEKAGKLMQGALKKYTEGDFEAADKERQQANELYDMAQNYASMEAAKTSMLYGENKNFGILYAVLEENAPKWFTDKKNRKAIREAAQLISEDATLKAQFDVYNACANVNEGIDVENYVDEIFKHTRKLDRRAILESNGKLLDLMRKHDANEMVEVNEERLSLYEAVEFLLLNEKKVSNMGDYLKNRATVCDFLKNHVTPTKTVNEAVVEAEMGNLNEDEMKVMESIAQYGNGDIAMAFENLQKELSEDIRNAIIESKSDERDRWVDVLHQVNEMKYDNATGVELFIKLHEIKNLL